MCERKCIWRDESLLKSFRQKRHACCKRPAPSWADTFVSSVEADWAAAAGKAWFGKVRLLCPLAPEMLDGFSYAFWAGRPRERASGMFEAVGVDIDEDVEE